MKNNTNIEKAKQMHSLTGNRKEVPATKVMVVAGSISRMIADKEIAEKVKFKILNIDNINKTKFKKLVLSIVQQQFNKQLNNLLPKD